MNYDDYFEIETQDLENLYNINYNLRYVYPLDNKWVLMGQVGASLSSNLRNSIQSEDFNFTGGINAIKRGGTLENPSRLLFGLNYVTITGKPRVLPMISYVKKVNDTFSYGLGFPDNYAKINFNEKHSLKSLIWVNGFYTNLSDPIFINANMESWILRISFNIIVDDIDLKALYLQLCVNRLKKGYTEITKKMYYNLYYVK